MYKKSAEGSRAVAEKWMPGSCPPGRGHIFLDFLRRGPYNFAYKKQGIPIIIVYINFIRNEI